MHNLLLLSHMCLSVVEQIAFADRILLNKTDLVNQEEKDAIKQRIKVCVYVCRQLLCSGCVCKCGMCGLLFVSGFRLSRSAQS